MLYKKINVELIVVGRQHRYLQTTDDGGCHPEAIQAYFLFMGSDEGGHSPGRSPEKPERVSRAPYRSVW